jgi:hypothetical protein
MTATLNLPLPVWCYDIVLGNNVKGDPDDTQLYASCQPKDKQSDNNILSNCAAEVAGWCASRRLQLNADKTEVI